MKYNLPVIVLNNILLLPFNEIKLEFDDELSKNIIEEAEMFHDNKILVVTRFSNSNEINMNELPKIGTLSRVSRKLELPNGKVRVILNGVSRVGILEYLNTFDSIESLITDVPKILINDQTNFGIVRKLKTDIENYVERVPYVSNSLLALIKDSDNLDEITDIIINHMNLDINDKFKYLLEINPIKRSEMILKDIYKEQQLFNIEKTIDTKVKKELDTDEKKFYLKEKIKLIKNEIGEISPKEKEIEILKNKVEELDIPSSIKNKVLYEIDRYENMSNLSPELSMVKNYIDLVLDLPWNNVTKDIEDLNIIKSNLDSNHYGLTEVKNRIIEYLAVKKESKDIDTPIICLVGPPGVGKTTLAYSIAKSMGRKFVKISVGGVDDEAIIKGYIRTYLGATPGKIIDGIRRAKTNNPVFLIDEIDKMSGNYKGDPRSAILEVLDTSQNKTFKDNYLEEDYDLSKVLFITTANDIESIPVELKDRLEIININGYTELEKLDITKEYLIPRICSKHGIKNIKISDEDILGIIRYYTKESGLRELERCISKIVRKLITDKVVNKKRMVLNIKNIETYLGKRIYEIDTVTNEIGICNALSYSNKGGDIVPIEVNHYKGNSNLIVTGSLGEILEESTKISLSYIKANYKLFNIDYKEFDNDIHINIPNISIPKEGPCAGVAITTAIISDLANIKIKGNIAFVGEITLRGNILKVGKLKEKIIGAYINNIDKIFIPYSNKNDLESIPEEIKEKITFILVKKYEEVYEDLMEN